MAELSIIICTHNPRPDYLSRTLEALRAQTLPMAEWELLVVDNASRSPVAALVSLTWHPNARHIKEGVLGLTPARLRGIQEARGEVLVFVDDDSLLEPSYLEIAMGIAKSRPELGCWGAGRIQAEYEKPPPEWLAAYDDALAIRCLDRDMWANITALNRSLPFGVGMCLRRTIASRYASLCDGDDVRRALDRSGDSLASCGDTDIGMLSCALGMGTASFAGMKITHLIPERRTTLEYMRRLIAGKAASQVVLSSLYELDIANHNPQRIRILKLKYLFLWIRYVASGFPVQLCLAVSKMRGELRGFKRLQDLGLLGQKSLTDKFAAGLETRVEGRLLG
jgi:glycosyltransferase involved in cell wall biosynthesis